MILHRFGHVQGRQFRRELGTANMTRTQVDYVFGTAYRVKYLSNATAMAAGTHTNKINAPSN